MSKWDFTQIADTFNIRWVNAFFIKFLTIKRHMLIYLSDLVAQSFILQSPQFIEWQSFNSWVVHHLLKKGVTMVAVIFRQSYMFNLKLTSVS